MAWFSNTSQHASSDRIAGHDRAAAVLLLVVHAGLLTYSAYVHSPTLNEPGHLVAGISHWKFGRFELDRVNPPLVRMVAALPVMAVGYEEDWSGFFEGPGARPVSGMGTHFVAANGDRSFFLFMIARWACIPFSLLGGIVCFLWARSLYGRPAGVLACALWCFSPNILAHASLITSDAPAAAVGLAACYTFWLWLKRPAWEQTLVAGSVLGAAELAKTTLITFYPLWPLLWMLYRLPNRPAMHARDWLREGAMLLTQTAIAVSILNLGYNCEGSFKQLEEFHFVSRFFSGRAETYDAETPANTAQPDLDDRFAGSWLGGVPVPFPRNYLAGIDVQRRDFEDYGRPSYLRGEFRHTGWWYYYLYALAVKVPLGTWGLLLVTTLCRLSQFLPRKNATVPLRPPSSSTNDKAARCTFRDELVLLCPSLVILTIVSSQTGFSEHMRYVLPIFPFVFVWLGQIANMKTLLCRSPAFLQILAAVLLLWSIGSSLWIYPHSLSYFSELVGGPNGGHAHLIHSNLDWGQDLRYLKWWLDQHPEARPFYMAYFGYFDPSDVDVEFSALPADVRDPAALKVLEPGFYAMSVNCLLGYPWHVSDGKGGKKFLDRHALGGFRNVKPVAKAGYSICVYRVTSNSRLAAQREHGGPAQDERLPD